VECENLYCVYWTESGCMLDEISLDLQGRCYECIYVSVTEEVMAKGRKKVLEHFEKEYKLWNQKSGRL